MTIRAMPEMPRAASTVMLSAAEGNARDRAMRRLARARGGTVLWALATIVLAALVIYQLIPADRQHLAVEIVLIAGVVIGAIPVASSAYQYGVVGFHRFVLPYDRLHACYPRVAILVPAWNEGAVIAQTIDRLLQMDYPADRLRVYVADDASTDSTPDLVWLRTLRHPDQVVHIRRDLGGEGKAHTLNYGLQQILADPWAEAVCIMDADVLFEPDALRKMTRHFSDPTVGAVTAYIKEGTRHPGTVNRFVAYEYITAQAAARRAQNVLGALACLAGGAQLHTRANLAALGGRIATSTLAEDTSTTLTTQLAGRRVIFEGNAVVWAEEPDSLVALWKQRLRWGRGNLQITLEFSPMWLRPLKFGLLGRGTFALFWFTVLLMPWFMVAGSVSLITLAWWTPAMAWELFHAFWIFSALVYLFGTGMACAIDPETARRTWRQALLFPGLVSLALIVYSLWPPLFEVTAAGALARAGYPVTPPMAHGLMLGMYAWLTLCMGVSYLAKILDEVRGLRWLSRLLLYIGGFGPFLCAVTLASFWAELRGAEVRWDKTEKTGRMAAGR